MTLYTGAPQCQKCGGALLAESDTCLCGGRSQYRQQPSGSVRTDHIPVSLADAIIEMDRRREPPSPG